MSDMTLHPGWEFNRQDTTDYISPDVVHCKLYLRVSIVLVATNPYVQLEREGGGLLLLLLYLLPLVSDVVLFAVVFCCFYYCCCCNPWCGGLLRPFLLLLLFNSIVTVDVVGSAINVLLHSCIMLGVIVDVFFVDFLSLSAVVNNLAITPTFLY